MAIPANLKQFLQANHVAYEVLICKRPCYRTRDVLQLMPARKAWVAKSIVVKADDRFILAVLEADGWIELQRLKQAVGAVRLRMANEVELASLFPKCQFGAIPALGNLYGLEVWISQPPSLHKMIIFKAGTHVETILMQYGDFEKLVAPRIAYFDGGKPWL